MRQTHQVSTLTSSSSRSAHNSDNHLDALLDDLQSTVSRTGSFRGGGINGSAIVPAGAQSVTTGYREVRRTVRDEATGENSTEYKIEYLQPANSTTHVTEFNTSGSSDLNTSGYGTAGQRYTSSLKRSDQLALGSNISSGIDSGLFEPGGRVEEKHFHEERREVQRGGSSGARRELVFTGPKSRDPSPSSQIIPSFPPPGYDQPLTVGRPIRQEVYRYEKTTTSKTIAPDGTVIHHDGDGGRKSIEEVRTVRSPSPQYLQYRDPSPSRPQIDTSGYGKTNQSYTSSYHHESRSATRTPPPHRSPSPVSFTQPPPPSPPSHHTPPPISIRTSSNTTTTRSTAHAYDQNYHTAVPQPKFTPVDHLTYSPQHQSTHKYTTTTRFSDSGSPLDNKPRPFPVSPEDHSQQQQQPPKQLDDLMASFSDVQERTDTMTHSEHHTSRTDTSRRTENGPHVVHVPIEKEKAPGSPGTTVKKEMVKREETKNITGPPVYYPKGELFTKKEESSVTHGNSASGGGKYKAKAAYKYESGSKYKESSDTKVVPVCVPCPCCCAAPCSIM